MRKNCFVMMAVCWLVSGPGNFVSGQASAPSHRMDTALLAFFNGRWTGEGAFAVDKKTREDAADHRSASKEAGDGGVKIAADVSFGLSLDSCWVVYEHRDQAPNRYKATSMWGVDAVTGEFFAYIFDNFHGHRQLAGNGWKDGKLLISGQSYIPGAGLYFEHFLYERLSDTQFKMTYETSRDGVVWQLGDWLVFTKVAAAGK